METVRPGARFEGPTPIVRVGSLAASPDHCTRVLGFQVDWRHASGMASVSRDRASVMLCERDQESSGTWYWCGVSSVEPLFNEFTVAGAFLRVPPTNYPWAYEMHVEDLDGPVLRFGSEPRGDRADSDWAAWYRDTSFRDSQRPPYPPELKRDP